MTQKKDDKDLLVALMPRVSSLDILKNEGWYHIPEESAPKPWPPRMLAFYQGKVFGKEQAYQVQYYGEVSQIDILPRKELFPDDEKNLAKAEKKYYRLELKSLEVRETPIISYRPRRLVFIPTTHKKFELAEQINDLFNGSFLEDRLWKTLKRSKMLAERQWKLVIKSKLFFLDFAIFCKNGKLAIETDGYTTHYDSIRKIDEDTWRQNEIINDEWHLLRYTTNQISDEGAPYLEQIQTQIKLLGGLEAPDEFKRKVGEEPSEYRLDDYDEYFRSE